jgi:hypothetical protein
MRKAPLFLIFLIGNILLFFLVFIHASFQQRADQHILQEQREMVKRLELTDLCLFTEASYTRHLSQADRHTPFQDYPLSLEHFPSGAILLPPQIIKRTNGKLD